MFMGKITLFSGWIDDNSWLIIHYKSLLRKKIRGFVRIFWIGLTVVYYDNSRDWWIERFEDRHRKKISRLFRIVLKTICNIEGQLLPEINFSKKKINCWDELKVHLKNIWSKNLDWEKHEEKIKLKIIFSNW